MYGTVIVTVTQIDCIRQVLVETCRDLQVMKAAGSSSNHFELIQVASCVFEGLCATVASELRLLEREAVSLQG